MLSFPLVCKIVVIESCLRMSAVSLDLLVCATCARNGDGGLSLRGALRLRGAAPRLSGLLWICVV
jgi:hypothetical protein